MQYEIWRQNISREENLSKNSKDNPGKTVKEDVAKLFILTSEKSFSNVIK